MKNKKKWIGVALGAFLAGGAFTAPGAQAQNAPRLGGDNYYWSNGEKVPLGGSSWVGVQVQPNSSTAILNGLTSERALDGSRGAIRYRKNNFLFVPVDPNASTAQQNALRARLEDSPRVEKTVRTFGAGSSPVVDSGEINVRFKSGVKGAALQQTLAAYGASIVRPLGGLVSNGYVVRVGDKYSAVAVANGLYESGATIFSQPNFLRKWQPRGTVPARTMAKSAAKSVKAQKGSSVQKREQLNDPLLPLQWHLNNIGQGGGLPGADISAYRAWDVTKGDPSIIIAILDDGVDTAHEEFAGKLVPGFDFVDGDADPSPGLDSDNHGTACAGVAAAQGDNAIGVSGAAPDCLIMPLRVLGDLITDATLADAFRFAANNGADVLSNSFGPPDGLGIPFPISEALKAGIDYTAVRGRGGKGSVILFAAGNGYENADLDGLASYFRVISVAASNNFDQHSDYSDFGQTVDICAPSNDARPGYLAITTVDRTGDKGYSATNYTNTFGGTSSATPLAAGVAALILSVEPTLTNVQVQQRLEDTADKISPAMGQYDSDGHSPFFGYGRVNAYAALLGNPPKTTLVAPADGASLSGITNVSAITSNDKQVKSLTFDYRRLFGSARRENLNLPIPDFNFDGVTAEATIEGAARSLPVAATVTAQIQHSFVGDLRVSLISPGGREEVIYDHNNGDDKFLDLNVTLPVANRPLSGVYKLRVVDDVQEDTGVILNFGIDLTGEFATIGTIDGAAHNEGTPWTLPFDVSKLPSGQYQVRATALSTLGRSFSDLNTNISISGVSGATYVLSGKVTKADGSPLGNVVVTLQSGTDGAVVQTARTNASGIYTFGTAVVSGIYTVTPSLSGTIFSPPSRTFTLTSANISNINFTVGLRDTTRPILTVKTPEANQLVRSLAGISGTAKDNDGGSGIEKVTAQVYRFATRTTPAGFLNAQSEFSASTPSSQREIVATGTTNFGLRLPALADGRYATRVTATDKAGNKTSSAVLYFTVDSAPPVVTIINPTNGATLVKGTAPTLGGSVSDNSGGLQSLTAQLFRDASAGATAGYFNGREFVRTATPIELPLPIAATFRLNAGALQSGRYRLIVTATDKVGNKAAATSIFTVRPSTPTAPPPSVPR